MAGQVDDLLPVKSCKPNPLGDRRAVGHGLQNARRPVLVVRIDHQDVKPMPLSLHGNPRRVVHVQVDVEQRWQLRRRPGQRQAANLPFMNVLVDDLSNPNTVTPQPPANRTWRPVRGRINHDLVPKTLQAPQQVDCPSPQWFPKPQPYYPGNPVFLPGHNRVATNQRVVEVK